MTNIKIIGETVQKLRRTAGETQEQLANAVGVSAQAVSKWENGGVPDIELLPQIAEHYGVTIDALFGNDLADTAGLKQAFLKTFAETPNDEWIDKVFELMWDIECTAFGNNLQDFSMSDAIRSMYEEGAYEPNQCYSSVNFKGGFTHMGFEKLKYFLIVPQAADWDAALFGPDRSAEVDKFDYPAFFKDISDPVFFNVLLEMHRRNNDKQFTKSIFERLFGLKSEKVDEIVKLLTKYRFLRSKTVDLDGEAMQLYTFHGNLCFVALLIFARQVIARPGVWNGYIGNNQYTMIPKSGDAKDADSKKITAPKVAVIEKGNNIMP